MKKTKRKIIKPIFYIATMSFGICLALMVFDLVPKGYITHVIITGIVSAAAAFITVWLQDRQINVNTQKILKFAIYALVIISCCAISIIVNQLFSIKAIMISCIVAPISLVAIIIIEKFIK